MGPWREWGPATVARAGCQSCGVRPYYNGAVRGSSVREDVL